LEIGYSKSANEQRFQKPTAMPSPWGLPDASRYAGEDSLNLEKFLKINGRNIISLLKEKSKDRIDRFTVLLL